MINDSRRIAKKKRKEKKEMTLIIKINKLHF